jgi:hypothetical protein
METNKDTRYEEDNKLIVTYLSEKDLKAKYAKILESKHAIKRDKPVTKIRSIAPWMKYAAVGVLLLSTIFLTRQYLWEDSHQQMALDHIRETRILGDPSSMRKDNAFIEQMRIDANYAFINQNFDESARLFESIVSSEKVENDDYFYLGISYLRGTKPQAKAALDAFDKIASDSPLAKETKWFQALAYLLDGDSKSSKSLLNEIILEKSYKYREATEILSSL